MDGQPDSLSRADILREREREREREGGREGGGEGRGEGGEGERRGRKAKLCCIKGAVSVHVVRVM